MGKYLFLRILAVGLVGIEAIFFFLQSNLIDYSGFILENNQPQLVGEKYLWW